MKNLINYASLVGIVFILASCNHTQTVNEITQNTYVKVEEVNNNQGTSKMTFNGKVKEKSLTSLSFRVGGPLVKLNVQTGDYVRKGQLIAQIDKRDYTLQVESTELQWKQLEGEYWRYKELYNKNKVPANSYEKIESGYKLARTAYDNAVNQLNDTELRAPVSGYIYEKFSENYQTVGPGQPIVSIIDLSLLEIVIAVPENRLNKIKSVPMAYVSVKNADVDHLEVKRVSVSEKTKKDGMYEVKYLLPNTKHLDVTPGMTAELNLYYQQGEAGITIPSSAIFYKNQQAHVWLFNEENNTVNQAQISINDILTEGRIKVKEGLCSGDKIVTAGVNHLSEGQLVEPLRKTAKTNIGGLL